MRLSRAKADPALCQHVDKCCTLHTPPTLSSVMGAAKAAINTFPYRAVEITIHNSLIC